ncbi:MULTISPECIES: HdaA/DnaA family protein [Falsihalocynthiibacter]|uniref:HdaA/DnaA family protein n=1 Tax=Falsihalocynthiibacter TaxID=2854182 RepID=UPI003001DF4C
MPRQLTLNLPVRTALGREDFFVSPSNAHALETLSAPTDWPLGKIVLCGEIGSGKTHLVHVWAEQTQAQILQACDLEASNIEQLAQAPLAFEDADQIAQDGERETLLFHLHNLILANGHFLLLTARTAPSRWNIALPDLKSRMEGTAVVQLQAPDDMLLTVVLLKHFNDRQLHVAPEVVDYIIKRIPRSLGFIGELCVALDQTALSEKRAITRPLVAKVLDVLDKNHTTGA